MNAVSRKRTSGSRCFEVLSAVKDRFVIRAREERLVTRNAVIARAPLATSRFSVFSSLVPNGILRSGPKFAQMSSCQTKCVFPLLTAWITMLATIPSRLWSSVQFLRDSPFAWASCLNFTRAFSAVRFGFGSAFSSASRGFAKFEK